MFHPVCCFFSVRPPPAAFQSQPCTVSQSSIHSLFFNSFIVLSLPLPPSCSFAPISFPPLSLLLCTNCFGKKKWGKEGGTSFERDFDMHSTAAVMAEHSILTVCLVGWLALLGLVSLGSLNLGLYMLLMLLPLPPHQTI